jgi:hypothetical protein
MTQGQWLAYWFGLQPAPAPDDDDWIDIETAEFMEMMLEQGI